MLAAELAPEASTYADIHQPQGVTWLGLSIQQDRQSLSSGLIVHTNK